MGNRSQTTTSNPYGPSQQLYGRSADIVGQYLNNPNSTAVYDGQRTVDPSQYTQNGLSALANNAGYAQSRGLMSDVVGGKYLEAGNPYVQKVQDQVRSSVMPGLNATFAKSGMVGSTMHQGTLSRGLSDGMAQPLFQNYENERNRQMSAASALPGMDQANAQNQLMAGQISEGYDRERIAADQQRWLENRDSSLGALQRTMPFTQAIGGAGGTQTSTTSQSPWATAAGVGMMGLGAMSGMGGGFGALSNMFSGGGSPWQQYNTGSPYGQAQMAFRNGFSSPGQRY